MAAEAPIRETESRHFALRFPRPVWILLSALTIGAVYAGGYWHFFRAGPTYEIGGVSYSLDIERAVVRARRQHRPVLLYFTGVNCVNARRMERTALRAPTAVSRLERFACAAVFTDRVPFVDEHEGKRLGDENLKLQERLLGEVVLPAVAVVDPEFDPASPSDRHLRVVSLGIVEGVELIEFLDAALADWNERRPSKFAASEK